MPRIEIKAKKAVVDSCLGLFSIIMLLSLWYLVSYTKMMDIPSPIITISVFLMLLFEGDPFYELTLWQLILASLRIVLIGWAISIIVAVPLGIVMGMSKRLEVLINTSLELIRPIPPLAWIPLGYIIFAPFSKPSLFVQIFIVFIGSFFPILINTLDGVKSIDKIFFDVAKSCGASTKDVFVRVTVPAVLPAIMTGVRIGLGIGWMCIIAAEFVGGKTGIGYYIWSVYTIGGRGAEIIAGMISIGLVSFCLNKALLVMEKRLMPWQCR